MGRTLAAISLIVITGSLANGLRGAPPGVASPAARPIDAIRAGCTTFDPFFAVTSFAYARDAQPPPDEPAVIAFADTDGDTSDARYTLATQRQVGTVYGLAYDARREKLYAAAYHKRSSAYGPAGPGGIYEIDLDALTVRTLATLDAGNDRHDYRSADDEPAAQWVGRTGLADIELDDDGSTLYVANLYDNRVRRLSLPDGTDLGSFPHGAQSTAWARNARLFGLAYAGQWLYHAVVDSRLFESEPGGLRGYIYRSRADGSEMGEVASFDLTYSRGEPNGRNPTGWDPWSRWDNRVAGMVGSSYTSPAAQPVASDIELARDGSMIIGLRDRTTDMLPILDRVGNHLGAGDTLLARPVGEGWDVVTDYEHFADLRVIDESSWGGLAQLAGFDVTVSSALAPDDLDHVGAYWYWNDSGGIDRVEPLLPVSHGGSEGSNGLGDVESLCPHVSAPSPPVEATATAAAATATERARATRQAATEATPPGPIATPVDFVRIVAESCLGDNPFAATVCYPTAVRLVAGADAPTIMGFHDTPADWPIYPLAWTSSVGTVWGLAYRSTEGALYASAFLKRLSGYGPLGPGGVYRIDVATGRVSPFATVPNAGRDTHPPKIDNSTTDLASRDLAGKLSLGDLDLSEDERTLYVMNLNDRRIYRYDAASGQELGSFAHGAAGEPWDRDARPFALKWYHGRLYHGVVNSAESTRDAADLTAYVYDSAPDGSDMHLAATVPLSYDRGNADLPSWLGQPVRTVPLQWLPWKSGDNDLAGGRSGLAVYPQPILADIEFSATGDMLLGLRDRRTDMSTAVSVVGMREHPGIGLGDVLRVPAHGGAYDPPAYDHFRNLGDVGADRAGMGGLAVLPGFDILVDRVILGSTPYYDVAPGNVTWYDDDGNPTRLEVVCSLNWVWPERFAVFGVGSATRLPASSRVPPARPLDDENAPSVAMGDVEVLCGPTPTATPSPSRTPIPSPGASPTATQSPTAAPSSTGTPTVTPGRIATPLFLPIVLNDRCDPTYQHADVVLLIDASSTMLESTSAGRPKSEAAKEAARRLLDRMKFPGDQAAVVSFNADVTVERPLTGDRAALDDALQRIANRELTRIHLGIAAAHGLLESPEHIAANTPAIVLLTDGISNPEPAQLAIDAAAAAKRDGVTIFAVGLGESIDRADLVAIASGEDFFRYAPDGEDLGPIYERIAYEIPCPPSAYWPYPGHR